MNIFYLHDAPKECAAMHTDKHVVKMILEYAQLLSTAHYVCDGATPEGMYKPTHINHPSAIWVRKSKHNYTWLCYLLLDLCSEYTYRYNKVHKVEREGLCYLLLKNVPKNIGKELWTEPTPAMPDEYKVKDDSIASYRKYYASAKTHLHSWKRRPIPSFITEAV
jgi:hypothetical protein